MSQSTIVPGMEQGPSTGYANNPYSNPMSQQQQPGMATGTVVPGMPNVPSSPAAPKQESTKPIMGFLYSVSRKPTGEYWTLYQGLNTIGSDPQCDIVLPEASVSREHARIVIRKNVNPVKTIAAIQDSMSTVGTMVNGVSLDFGSQECFNGDIIKIGANYELLFILIDAEALGLHPQDDFKAVEQYQPEPPIDPMTNGGFPQFPGGQPFNGGGQQPMPSPFSPGTVGVDVPDPCKGGTAF